MWISTNPSLFYSPVSLQFTIHNSDNFIFLSFIHSLSHSFIYSFIHSFIHTLIHSLNSFITESLLFSFSLKECENSLFLNHSVNIHHLQKTSVNINQPIIIPLFYVPVSLQFRIYNLLFRQPNLSFFHSYILSFIHSFFHSFIHSFHSSLYFSTVKSDRAWDRSDIARDRCRKSCFSSFHSLSYSSTVRWIELRIELGIDLRINNARRTVLARVSGLVYHCPCPPARNLGSRVSGIV